MTQLSAALRAELGPRDGRVTAVEPGLTGTELGEHIDNTELSGAPAGMFDSPGGLSAGDVADVIPYVAGRPRHVNLRQVVILPTRQV